MSQQDQLTIFAAAYGQLTTLTQPDGSIWFHGGQLLANLQSKRTPHKAKLAIEERLGDGETIELPIQDSLGRIQSTLFFSESATTWLISRSRTAAGKALDRKIHTEILPQIRKTGAYQPATKPEPLPEMPTTLTGVVLMAAQQLHRQQEQIDQLQIQADRQGKIQQEAAAALATLPEAEIATPVLVTRRAILKAVNNYCVAKGIEQRAAWNLLYEELRLRCGVAVKLRAKVSPQETYLDIVVRLGYGEQLYAIALDLFGLNKGNLVELRPSNG